MLKPWTMRLNFFLTNTYYINVKYILTIDTISEWVNVVLCQMCNYSAIGVSWGKQV